MIEVYYPSYFSAETHVVAALSERLEKIEKQAAEPSSYPVDEISEPLVRVDAGPAPE